MHIREVDADNHHFQMACGQTINITNTNADSNVNGNNGQRR